MQKHRVIAINLPQFHPFKENDEWWGKGFTEWTNVTKAKPRFRGHYQPHLPSDTGFYDLRLPESRDMQADMAKEAGLYGFCYYHYWFNGKRLMDRPINEILESKKPDFPFMFCWANENWARNWDGGFKNVLMEQCYCDSDDIAHMKYLCEKVFSDSRYIRIKEKPFFVVYKPYLIPNIKKTIDNWRTVAREYGMELYLGFMSSGDADRKQILDCGFDAAIDFQPHFLLRPKSIFPGLTSLFYKVCWKLSIPIIERPDIWDYKDYIETQINNIKKDYKEYPCVTPSWDNSPRRVNKKYWAIINNTPKLFGEWLTKVLTIFEPFGEDENFVFINAWNEWAEGNHLEPDQKWGRAYIEETRKVIDKDNL